MLTTNETKTKKLTKKQEKEIERMNAIKALKDMVKAAPKKKHFSKGWTKTIYTKLDHVSASGMSRNISLFIVNNGELCDITYWAAKATDSKIAYRGGIKIGGCGMDMGFALVDQIMYSIGIKDWQAHYRQEWI